MTLGDFINTYDGDDWLSIEGYCEEVNKDDILAADWYKEVEFRTVESWKNIGGGAYEVEIWIRLSQDERGESNETSLCEL